MSWPARIRRTAQAILASRHACGAIPWFPDGPTDPWNHIEAAMGLAVAGETTAAERSYEWLRQAQASDGSWLACYDVNLKPTEPRVETNFVAYIATGCWHQYLVTGDAKQLKGYWPHIEAAIDYVLRWQSDAGDIAWVVDDALVDPTPADDALLTGCSSIHRSLLCATAAAKTVGVQKPQWVEQRELLASALCHRPDRFDRSWPSKARFSMDWFYPILSGALSYERSLQRLANRWHAFVEPGLGCRCVVEEPWVTIAETAELIMACAALGERERGQQLLDWIRTYQAEDGAWWTGYQFANQELWPQERPTWTAGAVLLAVDALHGLTPASGLFSLPKVAVTQGN